MFTLLLDGATIIKKFKIDKIANGIRNQIVNLKPMNRITAAVAGAAIIGGIAKRVTLEINRIPSKEFKIDKQELKARKQEIKQAQADLKAKKNTLSSKEYKEEKSKIKKLKKALSKDKKALKHAKRKENWKNFGTGALYSAMSPLTEFALGIPGAAAIIGISTVGRAALNKQKDEKYSWANIKNNILDNVALNTVVLGAATLPIIKHVKYNKGLDKNLKTVLNTLERSKLDNHLSTSSTAYRKLENMLVKSPAIEAIRYSHVSIDDKIKNLTDENIFAVKFMQISNSYGEISHALREDCPASRTIDQAKDIIAHTFQDRFEVSKRLGVGTVAETYLAKDKTTGKEVCLKLIKEGITPEKIEKDKQKMIKMIDKTIVSEDKKKEMIALVDKESQDALALIDDKNIKKIIDKVDAKEIDDSFEFIAITMGLNITDAKKVKPMLLEYINGGKSNKQQEKELIKEFKKALKNKVTQKRQEKIQDIHSKYITQKEKQTLINNIEDLAKGISQEVDLANEMKAANQLKEYTHTAHVVKPIEVKDNIYVMERANGISLKTLQEVVRLEGYRSGYESELRKNPNTTYYHDAIIEINEKIAELKSKSPDFDNINLTPKEIGIVLDNYMKVISEQFDSIKRNGKTIHADIHPGNVFVDIKGLKAGNKKVLTLIDTGNTITMTKEQSQRALQLQMFLKGGNVTELSKYIMEDAVLPKDMTKEQSIKIMEDELKKAFFDKKTAINTMTREEFFNLADAIMQEHNIVSGGTQLNLEKAKTSANKSFDAVFDSFLNKKGEEIGDDASKARKLLALTGIAAKLTKNKMVNTIVQEIKNMKEISPIVYLKAKFKKGGIATNSEEYLTYKYKQGFESSPEKMLKSMFDFD